MTTLVCDVVNILGTEASDGVVSLSASEPQYVDGVLVLPEFAQEPLVQGYATFENVLPGQVIVQVYWGTNRVSTIRATVPDKESVSLAELALDGAGRHPAVVSQVSRYMEQAREASEIAAEIKEYTVQAEERLDDLIETAQEGLADVETARTRAQEYTERSERAADATEADADQTGEDRSAVATWREHIDSRVEHADSQVERVEQVRDEVVDLGDGYAQVFSIIEQSAAASAHAATEAADRLGTAERVEEWFTGARQYAEGAESSYQNTVEVADTVEETVNTASSILEARVAAKVAEAEGARDDAEQYALGARDAAAAEVEKLKGDAPAAFDTLGEIAAELANNESERAALANTLATKATTEALETGLASKSDTGHGHQVLDIEGLEELIDQRARALIVEASSTHLWDGEGTWEAPWWAGPDDSVINLDTGEVHSVEDING